MDEQTDWARLARYFAGECSDAEQADIVAWAAADPSRANMLEHLRQAWEVAGEPDSMWNADAALPKLRRRMRGGDDTAQTRPLRRRPSFAALRTAAVLAGVTVLGAVGLRHFAESRLESVEAMQELATAKGERARFRLSDGTRVVIGPESHLKVPARFGPSERVVHLSGEAYFDVAPDPDRPFFVHAGGASTRVVGTEFNVRAYPGDAQVQVVVAHGQVAVRQGSGAETMLAPGEIGEMGSDGAGVATRTIDLERHLGWLQGQLVFEDTPLQQVCVELERWYGTPVRVGDAALASQQLTASFVDQPLDEVVEVVGATLNISVSRSGRTILFHPKRQAILLAQKSARGSGAARPGRPAEPIAAP